MEIVRDRVIEWTKENIGSVLAVFCIFILVIMLLLLKRQYSIGILGAVSITALALEMRARTFDKIVSVLVVFVLALGFMLFN